MSEQDAWQLSNDAAVAYERDFVPALFAQWPPIMAEMPADITTTPRSGSWSILQPSLSAISFLAIASAIGLRQVLPVQTNSTSLRAIR